MIYMFLYNARYGQHEVSQQYGSKESMAIVLGLYGSSVGRAVVFLPNGQRFEF